MKYRRIELIEIEQEKYVIVWGVNEVTGVNPSEDLDFTLDVTYFSIEKETEFVLVLSFPGRKPLKFSFIINLKKQNEIFQALIQGVPITITAFNKPITNNSDSEAGSNLFIHGLTSLYLPEGILEELKYHNTIYAMQPNKL